MADYEIAMIPLAPKFRTRGFDWTILQREGDVCLVEQNKAGWSEPAYNVVIVQKHEARVMGGNAVPAREGLPSWEEWGTYAWAYSDKTSAKVRFNEEVDRRQDALSPPPVTPNMGSKSAEGALTPPKSS